jgi:LuxR family transcriptional regulator, maltose regulon positive regulatory protein
MSSANPVEILRTKLYRPQSPERQLKRRRLFQLLEAGLHCQVTLVTAPAGYGKTVLISSWLNSQTESACWLSLESADNNPVVFLTYLVAAIKTIFPEGCAETSSLLRALDPPPLSILQTRLINELDLLPHKIIVILDDYHLIDRQEIHDVMIALVNHLPPNIHLLISAREDPPFPLAVWRARQTMNEIHTRDLRFSPIEAEQYLKSILGSNLPADTIKIFHEEAEGWITGLQLAAFSLRNADDRMAYVNSFKKLSSQNIREFLLDEAFANQPRILQEFLLQTSILNRFSASLCHVLDLSGASLRSTQDTIDILRRANLFITPLDDQGEWYRYHYLFAEMLQRRLKNTFEPQSIAFLHHKAAEWFARQGYVDDAIEHALIAGEEMFAIQIIEENIYHALNLEKLATIDRWLGVLPPQVMETRPRLMMVRAWIRNYRDPFESEPGVLIKSQAMLDTLKDDLDPETKTLLAGYNSALWPMYLTLVGKFEQGAAQGEFALKTLPANHFYVRGRALAGWALCMQAQGKGEAVETFLLKEKLSHPEVNAYTLAILCALSYLYIMSGKLDELEQAGLLLCKETEAHGFQILAGWGYLFSGSAYMLRNDLQQARKYFETAAGLRYIISQSIVRESMVALVLIHQSQGNEDEAQTVFNQLIDLEGGFFMDYQRSLQARMALARGEVKSALRWSLPSSVSTPTQPYILQEIPHLTQARVWMAEGTPESLSRALALLNDLYRVAEQTHCVWRMIEFLIWLAIAHFKTGEKDLAIKSLGQALRLASPGKVIYPFVEASASLPEILAGMDENSDEAQFLRQILNNLTFAPNPVISHPLLTTREVEILELLSQRLSNDEIAEALTITLDTVKKHCYHIYEKLGVSRRREAIAMAKKQGIIH